MIDNIFDFAGMARRAAAHPSWRTASAAELSALPDALEKFATIKLHSL